MAKFLLPGFRGEGGEPSPRGTRGWETVPMSELSRFANALAAPRDLQDSVFVDAIPDVWGKALLFAYSLMDQGHTLHERSVGAFRGFLAMLALRRLHEYHVTVRPVNIRASANLDFGAALSRLLPEAKDGSSDGGGTQFLSRKAGWDPAYVFLMDDQEAVGICSPLTLIAPFEGPDLRKAGTRKLTDGYRFVDPTERLGARDSAVLRQWLGELQQHLSTQAQIGPWRNAVMEQLQHFERALTRTDAQPVYDFKYANGPLDIATELFRPLGQAIGHALIIEDPEGPPLAIRGTKILVLDEEILDRMSPEAEIIGNITAGLLQGQVLGSDKGRLGRFELPDGWQWWRRKDFFLPQLSVLQMQGALVDTATIRVHGQPTDETPLLPLKEEVIQYLDPDYLTQNIWFERTMEGYVFKVNLPLSSGKNVEARQTYNELNRIDALCMPVTEIWPSIALEGWNAYYTFWTREHDQQNLYVRPSGVKIVEGGKEFEYNDREQVTITERPPRYLACSEPRLQQGQVTFEPRGMIMPRYQVRVAITTHKTFTIGFDFGTTNTHIFLGAEGDEPLPLSLQKETVSIFNTDQELRSSLMYRRFLPAEEDSAPFLSLLRRRVPLRGAFKPIRDAHVLFHDATVEKAQLDDPGVEAYLKWKPELNLDRNSFLCQLVLHAAYESRLKGAKEIKFIYSYPTSFGEATREILATFWDLEVPKMKGMVGIECSSGNRQTESVACASYFSRANDALLGTATMVMDIGGGTTDISAWHKNRLEVQTSIRLSGREMLLQPLKQSSKYAIPMLKRCMTELDTIFDGFSDLQDDAFFRRADALLRTHGDELLQRLPRLLQSDDFESFRSEIAIRVSALFYYAGMLWRTTNWNRADNRLPDVYVGGNGSRVLNWLAPPRLRRDSPAFSLIAAAYARGAGFDAAPQNWRLEMSPEPKAEVAKGLVYSAQSELAHPDDAIRNIAGEAFEAGQGQDALAETERMTPEIVMRGLRVLRAEQIETVLSVYNEFTNRAGSILFPTSNAPEIAIRAVDAMNDWAQRQTTSDPKTLEVTPLFITGVVDAFRLVRWRIAGKDSSKSGDGGQPIIGSEQGREDTVGALISSYNDSSEADFKNRFSPDTAQIRRNQSGNPELAAHAAGTFFVVTAGSADQFCLPRVRVITPILHEDVGLNAFFQYDGYDSKGTDRSFLVEQPARVVGDRQGGWSLRKRGVLRLKSEGT